MLKYPLFLVCWIMIYFKRREIKVSERHGNGLYLPDNNRMHCCDFQPSCWDHCPIPGMLNAHFLLVWEERRSGAQLAWGHLSVTLTASRCEGDHVHVCLAECKPWRTHCLSCWVTFCVCILLKRNFGFNLIVGLTDKLLAWLCVCVCVWANMHNFYTTLLSVYWLNNNT